MGGLLNLNYHIPRLNSRVFICLTMKNVFFPIWSTLVDLNLNNLLLFVDFLAPTSLTLVLLTHNLSLPSTLIARTRLLSVHTWTQLPHHSPHSTTITPRTLLDCSSLTTPSFALSTYPLTCHT